MQVMKTKITGNLSFVILSKYATFLVYFLVYINMVVNGLSTHDPSIKNLQFIALIYN